MIDANRPLVLLLMQIALLTAYSNAQAASDLADSAERGNWSQVDTLLDEGEAVNSAQADGTTALIWAAYHGDARAARQLIEAGADVGTVNRLGMSALSVAAENGSGTIVELLLDAGADANAAMPEGDTALMLAARSGDLRAVEALIGHGANVNAVEAFHGETALMWAAGENHADVVRALLENGAEIDAVSTEFSWDDLTQTGVASYLPRGGLTALMHAAREDAVDAARVLLEQGANPNATNPIGISVMRIAATNGHLDMARMLLEHGANPDDGTLAELARLRGFEMVRPAKMRTDETSSLELARLLIEAGADLHTVPEEPMSMQAWTTGKFRNDPAVFIAALEGDIELLDLFGEYEPDPERTRNPDGNTLLMAAFRYAPHQLGGGVPTPPRDMEEARAVADRVLALGDDIDAQRDDGMTALHLAASYGLDEHVKYLVERGARLDIKDKSNRMPIHVAQAIKPVRTGPPPPMPPPDPVPHESTIELLREFMAQAGIAEEEYVAPPPEEEEGESSEAVTDADDAAAAEEETASNGARGSRGQVFASAGEAQ